MGTSRAQANNISKQGEKQTQPQTPWTFGSSWFEPFRFPTHPPDNGRLGQAWPMPSGMGRGCSFSFFFL